jgi:hypothetical protein
VNLFVWSSVRVNVIVSFLSDWAVRRHLLTDHKYHAGECERSSPERDFVTWIKLWVRSASLLPSGLKLILSTTPSFWNLLVLDDHGGEGMKLKDTADEE